MSTFKQFLLILPSYGDKPGFSITVYDSDIQMAKISLINEVDAIIESNSAPQRSFKKKNTAFYTYVMSLGAEKVKALIKECGYHEVPFQKIIIRSTL